MKDEFFNHEVHDPHAQGLGARRFLDDENPASFYGGGWFGFEGLCAWLLACTGMNHTCYFYEVRSKRTGTVELKTENRF